MRVFPGFFSVFEMRVFFNGFVALVGPNQGETAACGWHYPRDMAVRIREVLTRPWVGVCVTLALSLHYFQCNRVKHFTTFLNKFISAHV